MTSTASEIPGGDVVHVTFDDVIFRVQSARGATMYWRHLLAELAQRPDVDIDRREARSHLSRYLPLIAPTGVVHSSLFRRGVPGRGQRVVMTAHDLAYERRFIDGRRAHFGRLERSIAIHGADGIVCVSNATHEDLVDYYGRHLDGKAITVAAHGPSVPRVGHHGVELHDPSERRLLLHVGHRDSYKNFETVRSALRNHPEFGDEVAIVVVGPPPGLHENDLVTVPRSGEAWTLPSTGQLFYLGRVTDNDLSGLYQSVDATLCPSRFEGFGFPVLDALHHGCPVICSRIPSHVEIAGDLATYFDPDDPESLADALAERRALPSDTADAMLSRFNWTASAEAHVILYQQLGAR